MVLAKLQPYNAQYSRFGATNLMVQAFKYTAVLVVTVSCTLMCVTN